jgi:hypothetical protein
MPVPHAQYAISLQRPSFCRLLVRSLGCIAFVVAGLPAVSMSQITDLVLDDMGTCIEEPIVDEYLIRLPFSVEAHSLITGNCSFGIHGGQRTARLHVGSPAFAVITTEIEHLEPDAHASPGLTTFYNNWTLVSGGQSGTVRLDYWTAYNPPWREYRPEAGPILIEPSSNPDDWAARFGGVFSFRAIKVDGAVNVRLYGVSPNPASIIVPPEYIGGVDVPIPMPPTCSRCVGITHGMADNSDNAWVGNFVDLELQAQPETCVVKHDWRAGANPLANLQDLVTYAVQAGLPGAGTAVSPTTVGRAYRNAVLEGHALAKRWIEKIHSGESSPNEIELIGHSFGGVVNAVAANDIYQYFKDYPGYGELGAKVGKLVILDTPQMGPFLPTTGHVNPESAVDIVNVYGGILNGAVGGPIVGPNVTNVGLDFTGRGITPVTIDPMTGVSVDLTNLGHTKLVDEIWPIIRNEVVNRPHGDYHEQFTNNSSEFLNGLPDYDAGEAFATFGVPGIVSFEVEKLQEWSGLNAGLVEIGGRLATKLEENSPAQISRYVSIPAIADFMQFEFLVVAAGYGDELVISFGDSVLYQHSLVGTQPDFVLSEPVFVTDLAGLTDQFLITLESDGNAGTAVYLSSFRFFDVVKLPGDYNSDGFVDAADYVVWRKNDGTQLGYDTWRMHFGETAGSSAGANDSANAAVPEPASRLMLILGMLAVFFRRRSVAPHRPNTLRDNRPCRSR